MTVGPGILAATALCLHNPKLGPTAEGIQLHMVYYDVFNGDADGICALQQLRLADPRETTLVTGVKRDIALLGRVDAGAGDEVTVLDVSLDKNRDALHDLLERRVRVRYFDHHYPGDIPQHPGLYVHIETLPDKGTSLLVDDYLEGRHRAWAVVGTFGDNFDAAARRAVEPLGLDEARIRHMERLKKLEAAKMKMLDDLIQFTKVSD